MSKICNLKPLSLALLKVKLAILKSDFSVWSSFFHRHGLFTWHQETSFTLQRTFRHLFAIRWLTRKWRWMSRLLIASHVINYQTTTRWAFICLLMVLMFDITVMRNGEKFHDSLHTYTNFFMYLCRFQRSSTWEWDNVPFLNKTWHLFDKTSRCFCWTTYLVLQKCSEKQLFWKNFSEIFKNTCHVVLLRNVIDFP